MARLARDLGGAIARMGASPALAGTVRTLRTLVPDLERVLNTLANNIGPTLAQTLVQIGRLFANLSGASGPLTVALQLINKILGGINDLASRFTAFRTVLVAAFTGFGIQLAILKVSALAKSWLGVAGAARTATVAEAEAVGAASGGGVAGRMGRAGAIPVGPVTPAQYAAGSRSPGLLRRTMGSTAGRFGGGLGLTALRSRTRIRLLSFERA
jgi:hypothetical protein